MAQQPTLVRLGTRVHVSGDNGTVRYVGPVGNTAGVWLGVEWDDPARGRHDGIKDGKRYFDCMIPGSGSFIRPSAPISYGQSFLHALLSKYVETPHGPDGKETVILGSSNGAIEVEAVNLDKIRGNLARVEMLCQVSLDAELVAFADPPRTIQDTCPNIQSLDLSNSLMPSVYEVSQITRNLPRLASLSLNRNRFTPLGDVSCLTHAFDSLEEVCLNRLSIDWHQAILLTSCMPQLRILELGYNRLRNLNGMVSLAISSSSRLETINFDGNELDDWTGIMTSLAVFPRLKQVILTSNRIASIPPQHNLSSLPSIRHIGLSFNRLEHWLDIDVLHVWLPQLETLNIRGNPLTDRNDTFRQLIIARIPSLLALNGSTITPKERTDSELFYLSQIGRTGLSSDEDIAQEHAMWRQLCEKHGRPQTRQIKANNDTLAHRLIQIKVFRLDLESPHDPSLAVLQVPPQDIRVLPSMTLRVLRAKLLKLFRVGNPSHPKHADMKLWLMMPEGGVTALHEHDDTQDLAWCGIENSSSIAVHVSAH